MWSTGTGYKYSTLFVEKCSTKTFAYHLNRKFDLVTAFKKLLHDYHPQRFPRCLEMSILHTNFDSLILDKPFNDVLVKKNIRLRHSQYLIKCHFIRGVLLLPLHKGSLKSHSFFHHNNFTIMMKLNLKLIQLHTIHT
jgi:hypothetical protein